MAQYIPPLDYYSGGLPFASVMYGSPESWFGLNLNPMCKPSEVSYFEILPQEPDSDSQPPKLVELDDVKLTRQSMTPLNRACTDTELVTFSGSLGLQLKSASRIPHNSYLNSTPLRGRHKLYADRKTTPGHHVIYWELLVKKTAISPNNQVLNQCCLAFEESLGSVYRRARAVDKSIGPLENGTFQELMDYALSK
ncbi:hypothetical protein WN944_005374 [Citrus x changshan-huyou]|uniref:GH3 C-terminal domain-containing protein n=1 Tax=Citrus x changshan-huyou TaxID=2935761 RepID=A0AAP0QH44_9ROSI